MNGAEKHLKEIRKKAIIYFSAMFLFICIVYGICLKFKYADTDVNASMEVDQSKIGPWSSYFTVVDTWESKGNHFYIVYADNNHVMYMIVVGYNSSGITALYNPDGSLQVYEEDM